MGTFTALAVLGWGGGVFGGATGAQMAAAAALQVRVTRWVAKTGSLKLLS